MECFLWFMPHYDQLPEDAMTPAVFFHTSSSTYIMGDLGFLKTPYSHLQEYAGCSSRPQMSLFKNHLFHFESPFHIYLVKFLHFSE